MISPQRFARLVTTLVVRRPFLWRLLRGRVRTVFDRLAPRWDELRSADALAPLEAALERIDDPPNRVLDLGTGTGAAALAVARRWPTASVVGVDLSEAMLAEARRSTPAELSSRVSFEAADAARLPYGNGSFDLVVLANMIPFFDELARVLAPDGALVVAFSRGADTPIYVPPALLRRELARRGLADLQEVSAGSGTALVASRASSR